jgi:hypothetical protein
MILKVLNSTQTEQQPTMTELPPPPDKIYLYPYTIPAEVLHPSRKGWVQVLTDVQVKRGDSVTLQPGYALSLAIKDIEVGILVTVDERGKEYYELSQAFFEFYLSALDNFFVSAAALHVYGDGTNYVASVIEHVIIEHWKPRVFTRAVPGEDTLIEVVLEVTPVGAAAPIEHIERVDLQSYAAYADD